MDLKKMLQEFADVDRKRIGKRYFADLDGDKESPQMGKRPSSKQGSRKPKKKSAGK